MPWPSRSGAITVWCSASRSMTPAHVWQLLPMPCSSRRAGPSPARRKASLWPWTTRNSCTAAVIAAVHHTLARRVLVPVDEGEQTGGVADDAQCLEPGVVEVAVVDHPAQLTEQRLPEP